MNILGMVISHDITGYLDGLGNRSMIRHRPVTPRRHQTSFADLEKRAPSTADPEVGVYRTYTGVYLYISSINGHLNYNFSKNSAIEYLSTVIFYHDI